MKKILKQQKEEEKVESLKKLWGSGKTASQIAEIIGGISRNAVIGKAHRLNLSAKIKTRTATSNQNFNNSTNEKNIGSWKQVYLDNKNVVLDRNQVIVGDCVGESKSVASIYQRKNNYNGPLDVLLDLAKAQKVDLEEISITKLADQFHEYITKEKDLNLEIASEYY